MCPSTRPLLQGKPQAGFHVLVVGAQAYGKVSQGCHTTRHCMCQSVIDAVGLTFAHHCTKALRSVDRYCHIPVLGLELGDELGVGVAPLRSRGFTSATEGAERENQEHGYGRAHQSQHGVSTGGESKAMCKPCTRLPAEGHGDHLQRGDQPLGLARIGRGKLGHTFGADTARAARIPAHECLYREMDPGPGVCPTASPSGGVGRGYGRKLTARHNAGKICSEPWP